jgi:2-amino-4-hydroxy-6-hydroxymethyldihydropteridine diphosphokinase
MPIVHIGIGSNLGDRRAHCLEAVKLLGENHIAVMSQSSLHETEPWGRKDQPHFINMAVEAETSLSPQGLLQVLRSIEKAMGRRDSGKWGPRIIDLDILFYDDVTLNSDDLKIPHPHLHERVFVLKPLAEIAPGKVHPALGKTVLELLSSISA